MGYGYGYNAGGGARNNPWSPVAGGYNTNYAGGGYGGFGYQGGFGGGGYGQGGYGGFGGGGFGGQQQQGPYGPGEISPQDNYNLQLQGMLANQYQQQLQQFMDQGKARGAEIYGAGTLGRVGEDRSQEMGDLMNSYQQQYEQGFSAPEQQALLEQYRSGINRDLQSGLTQSANFAANQGVRGALATRLSQDQQRQAQLGRQGANRQILLDELAYKQASQGQYGNLLGQAESNELARQQYNQQQIARELQGRLTYELGYGGLGAANLGAAQKYIAGQQQIGAAQAQSGGGGGK